MRINLQVVFLKSIEIEKNMGFRTCPCLSYNSYYKYYFKKNIPKEEVLV